MMGKRYLVFVRAGNNSLHKRWLEPRQDKMFDLYIEYYGEQEKMYASDGEYYSHCKTGTKFLRFFDIIRKHKGLIFSYDAVWLVDDDIGTDASDIKKMFTIFSENNLLLAQPALTIDSPKSHQITEQNSDYILRYTSFVECMMPIFSRDALAMCWRTFEKSRSSWGLDLVWSTLLGDPTDKIAIIDAVPMKHTRPVGGGDLYSSINVNPWEDVARVVKEYRPSNHWNMKVYGGILK